jgi:hypothetical protein
MAVEKMKVNRQVKQDTPKKDTPAITEQIEAAKSIADIKEILQKIVSS